MHYVVLYSDDIVKLQSIVNDALHNGYRPVGGVSNGRHEGSNELFFMQAVVKSQ